MEPKVFGFSKHTAIRVRNLVRESGVTGTDIPSPPENRRIAIAKTGSTGIPARNNNTPGTAVVAVMKIGNSDTLATTSMTFKAYNLSGQQIAADAYIVITKEFVSGKWLVVMESCPTE